jgi:hypothetical protein
MFCSFEMPDEKILKVCIFNLFYVSKIEKNVFQLYFGHIKEIYRHNFYFLVDGSSICGVSTFVLFKPLSFLKAKSYKITS